MRQYLNYATKWLCCIACTVNPAVAAWHYWAERIIAREKTTLPSLLGAMQWQKLFGE